MTLVHRFLALAAADPDVPAVVDATGVTSRARLLAAAQTIAGQMSGQGVQAGATVLLRIPGSGAVFHAADLAVLLCDAVPVSLPEQASPHDIDATLRTLAPSFILAAGPAGPLEDAAGHHGIPHHQVGALPTATAPGPALPEPGPDQPSPGACIVATSGSTAEPRFVLISQHTLIAGLEAWRRLWPASACAAHRVVTQLPVSHIAQRIMGHYLLCLYGATVHCATLGTLADTVAAARPQLLLGVPHTLAALAQAAGNRPDLAQALAQTALVVNGAAGLPAVTATALSRLGVQVASAYGMTETGVPALHQHLAERTGNLGTPVPGVRTRVSPEGELQLNTPYAARYVTQWPRTAPVGDPGGWISTGDHVTSGPEGLLLTGRVAATFKTARGRTVAPEPLEAHLRAQPDVAGACIVGAGRPHAIAIISIPAARGWDPPRRAAAAAHLLDGLRQAHQHGNLPWSDVTQALISDHNWPNDPDLVTRTGKPRREAISYRYRAALAALYDGVPNEPSHA